MQRKRNSWKAGLAVLLLCFASTQVYASSLDDAQQDKNEAEENKSDAEQILNQLEASYRTYR